LHSAGTPLAHFLQAGLDLRPGGSMPCILIVDDDEDTREALKDVLVNEGFEVRLSPGAQEAMAEITGPDAPHLVLLDAAMPGMSGTELLDWMSKRKLLDGIPVLLVTADANYTGHERAAALLRKPYDLEDLLRLAHELCR